MTPCHHRICHSAVRLGGCRHQRADARGVFSPPQGRSASTAGALVVEQIRSLNAATMQRERAAGFVKFVRLMAQFRGDPVQALGSVEGQRAAEPVQLLLKTAITAGGTISPAWAHSLRSINSYPKLSSEVWLLRRRLIASLMAVQCACRSGSSALR